jgi:hypothetical protein
VRRRCQHLFSNQVGFPFVDIPRLVNLEFGLQTQSLLLAALAAFTIRHRVIAAGASSLEARLRHPHHLFGDAVCILLILVSRLVDR